jgi:hypothetical protein
LSQETYVTQFDAEPEFWQYLNGLTPDGLIVELVQNELDAGATRTEITFETDRLVNRITGFFSAGSRFNRFTASNRRLLCSSQVGVTCQISLSLPVARAIRLSRSPSTLPPQYQPGFEAENRNGHSGVTPEFRPESGGQS